MIPKKKKIDGILNTKIMILFINAYVLQFCIDLGKCCKIGFFIYDYDLSKLYFCLEHRKIVDFTKLPFRWT